MKKLCVFVLAVLCCSAASANILSNGGMENSAGGTWPDSWSDRSPQGFWSNNDAHSGSYSLEIVTGANYTWQKPDVSGLQSGDVVEFGVWAKCTSDFEGDWCGMRLVPSEGLGGGVINGLKFKNVSGANDPRNLPIDQWMLFSGTWNVPSDYSVGDEVRVDIEYNVTQGTVWFDDAYMTPEPATLVLLGLGGLSLARRRR